MYEDYWGLSTSPFQNLSTADTYFPSAVHEEARARIFYAIKYDKGGVLFTGEIGTGKTTVSQVVVKRLLDRNINVGIINNPTLEINDFLREILCQLGVKTAPSNKLDLIHKIKEKISINYQKGTKTILIIDEAHLITDINMLEEMRLLLNYQAADRFLITLVLIGQPELRKIIHNVPPLEQRLTIRFHLKHLSINDTKNYIFHRLKHSGTKDSVFTLDAIKLIHHHSQGVPRRINQVCDLSLLIGYSEKKHWIDADTVKKVLYDEHKHGYINA